MPIKIFTALLVQDVQNDFLEKGAMPVAGAESVLEPISTMAASFDRVIATQEFRPKNHVLFADSHEGKKPGDVIEIDGQSYVLMPKFCVEGSIGADFATGLRLPMSRVIAILKGTDSKVDSYSAFLEADRKTQTGLQSYCEDRFVNRIYLCGLSRNGSLIRTALDALHYEHQLYWVTDAVAGLTQEDESGISLLKAKGVKFVTSEEVMQRDIR
ncbi:MAG TPA: isochorismatase family protein [Candidatus Aphodousia faecigallinarum]|uniref:nicotinamidase n=1 Tax=Candidatus Aphodousia faecigallinarum TaxID=2840677 RepID=A0A9D1IHL8_9BURK|nr:isochorismatase family protein [Candidatus Aphodousia faecigallinarum]